MQMLASKSRLLGLQSELKSTLACTAADLSSCPRAGLGDGDHSSDADPWLPSCSVFYREHGVLYGLDNGLRLVDVGLPMSFLSTAAATDKIANVIKSQVYISL